MIRWTFIWVVAGAAFSAGCEIYEEHGTAAKEKAKDYTRRARRYAESKLVEYIMKRRCHFNS